MLLQRVLAIELNGQRRRKEGPLDVDANLRHTSSGEGRKQERDHRVAVRLLHVLVCLRELIQRQVQLLRHQCPGWPGLLHDFQYSLRAASTRLEEFAATLTGL